LRRRAATALEAALRAHYSFASRSLGQPVLQSDVIAVAQSVPGVVAVDFGGRSSAVVDTKVRTRLVGDMQAELVADFFDGFSRGAKANVHVKTLYGRSNHHKIEAIFKCFARAMKFACSKDARLKDQLPSTKGLL
jgi:imidazoleglycerol phosphate dehydratase HisB